MRHCFVSLFIFFLLLLPLVCLSSRSSGHFEHSSFFTPPAAAYTPCCSFSTPLLFHASLTPSLVAHFYLPNLFPPPSRLSLTSFSIPLIPISSLIPAFLNSQFLTLFTINRFSLPTLSYPSPPSFCTLINLTNSIASPLLPSLSPLSSSSPLPSSSYILPLFSCLHHILPAPGRP